MCHSHNSISNCGCGCVGITAIADPNTISERCRTLAQVKLAELVYVQGLDSSLCERFQKLSDLIGLKDCAGNPISLDTPIVTCAAFQSKLCDTLSALAPNGSASIGVTQLVGKDCKTYTVPETPISVTDTPSIDLTASGSFTHTLQADLKLSAEADNVAEIRVDGLYVPPADAPATACAQISAFPTGANAVYGSTLVLGNDCAYHMLPAVSFPSVLDTLTVDLTLTGTVISADVRVNPDADNLLTITATGLKVDCDDVVSCVHSPVTVLDTSTVDLTLVGQQISASVKVSADPDNAISVAPDGLLVDVCAELQSFGNGAAGVFGVTSFLGNDCLYHVLPTETPLTAVDSTTIDFTTGPGSHTITGVVKVCPTPGLLTIDPSCGLQLTQNAVQDTAWGIGSDFFQYNTGVNFASFNPSGDPGNQIVAGSDGRPFVPAPSNLITVADTPCIDLTLTGNQITAAPIIAPAPNQMLSCTATGLRVSPPLGGDTLCISVDVTEGPAGVFTVIANPIISPDPSNQLACTPTGLFVGPSGTTVTALDTPCIDMTVTEPIAGSFVVSAVPIIDPNPLNTLSCGPAGLFSAGSDVTIIANDTDCINLTVVEGPPNTFNLTAALIMDPGADNVAECGANGLRVNGTSLTAIDTPCIDLTVAEPSTNQFTITAVPILDPDPCQAITCGVNGLLVQEHTSNNGRSPGVPNILTTAPLNEGDVVVGPVQTVNITNPSPCRDAILTITVQAPILIGGAVAAPGGPTVTTAESFVSFNLPGVLVTGFVSSNRSRVTSETGSSVGDILDDNPTGDVTFQFQVPPSFVGSVSINTIVTQNEGNVTAVTVGSTNTTYSLVTI